MIGPVPLFRHVARVERNVAVGESPTHQPLPPRYEPIAEAMPCSFWQVAATRGRAESGLREGPDISTVAESMRMLVPVDADIDVGDHVVEIRDPAGGVIAAEVMRVYENLWRSTHHDLGLDVYRDAPAGGS